LKFENCVTYFDPPYYNSFNEYSVDEFDHRAYINSLKEICKNETVSLLHSNSKDFKNVYKTDENIEEINCQDRMNSKKMDTFRIELLYYK